MKKESPVISKPDKLRQSPENFYWLRKAGLEHIQELSGQLWTDYNAHDPGVTLLEVLSYALTDLSYRISFPVMDLLAKQSGNLEAIKEHFATAIRALPSRPVTVNDYRKLLIDIAGVNNAWLSPAEPEVPLWFNKKTGHLSTEGPGNDPYMEIRTSGLYNVLIEFDEDLPESGKQDLWPVIRRRLHDNRNLTEDFVSFRNVLKQEFIVCGELDLDPGSDIEKVEAEVFFRIRKYFAPDVRSYSLKQMLEKGRQAEEIFEGTLYSKKGVLLEYGFFDEEELESSVLRSSIRLSDILRIVMEVEGVRSVRDLQVQPWMEKLPEDWNKWHIAVKKDHQPGLRMKESRLIHYKDMIPFRASFEKVEEKVNEKYSRERKQEQELKVEDYPMQPGEYIDPKEYHTIASDLPQTYGVGDAGLPEKASASRKAKALQLKSYLLFFDQVLANYFAQLGSLRELFSADERIRRSRYTQAVDGMKDMDRVLADSSVLEEDLDRLAESKSDFIRRRNQILDHLLSRFNEKFSEYAAIIYSLDPQEDAGMAIAEDKAIFLQEQPELSMHRSGAFNYLDEEELWDTQNVSGLQHRVARLAGIVNYSRRNLSKITYDVYEEKDEDDKVEYRFRVIDMANDKILISASTRYLDRSDAEAEMREGVRLGMDDSNYERKRTTDGRFYFNLVNGEGEVVARRIEYFVTEDEREEAIRYLRRFLKERYSGEGMFMIEHVLLRPREKDHELLPVCVQDPSKDCPESDPYSHRVSVILPAWEKRFASMDFRRFLEKTVRLETPAHVFPRICWVNEMQMSMFEDAYKDWLEAHARYLLRPGQRNNARYRKALERITEILPRLKNVYPEGTLHDCEEGSERNPVILGRTGVGDLENKEKQ